MELSIIVAAFNAEKYIRRCIRSVLSQTLSEYELIIVDDGSTDKTSQICDEYAKNDRRVLVLRKKNGGPISARMEGLHSAKGRFITFLDADDWVDDDLYEKLLIPTRNNNQIDVVIASYTIDDDKGRCQNTFEKSLPELMTSDRALREMFLGQMFNWAGCGKLYRRNLAEQFRSEWWSDISYGEDTEWNWKLLGSARGVFFSGESGYHYFDNANSLMHQNISMDMLVYIDRLERIISDIDFHEELYGIVNELLAVYCSARLIHIYQLDAGYEKETEKCRTALAKALDRRRDSFSEKSRSKIKFALMGKEKYRKKIIEYQTEIINSYNAIRQEADDIYIYGAGMIGKWAAECLQEKKCDVRGFVVSDLKQNDQFCKGIPVYSINEVSDKTNIGFLVAVNKRYEKDIERILDQRGLECYKCVGEYSTGY